MLNITKLIKYVTTKAKHKTAKMNVMNYDLLHRFFAAINILQKVHGHWSNIYKHCIK